MKNKDGTLRPLFIVAAVLFFILLLLVGLQFYKDNVHELQNAALVLEKTASSAGTGGQSGLNGYQNTAEPAPDLKISQDQMTTQDYADMLAANAEPGVVISGNFKIKGTAGDAILRNINLTNDEANVGWYYMTYELRLPDSSEKGYEVLFTTDLIEPGNILTNVTMNRALPAGEYNCILHTQPYYISTLTQTNNVDTNVVLIIN